MDADPNATKPTDGHGLGKLEENFGLPAGCFAAMLVVGAAAAVGGYLLLQRVSGSFGTFIAVGCLVGGPLVFGFAFKLRAVRMLIFENGLIWHRRGAAPFVCRWVEIDGLWENLTEVVLLDRWGNRTGNTYWKGDITIGKSDGWRVRLTEQDLVDADWDIHALRERIRAETQVRLLAQALAALGEGRTVKFGRVALGPDGLNDGFGVTPWAEIASMSIEGVGGSDPVLSIRKEGNWLVRTRIRPAEIANREIFFALAEQCLAARRPAAPVKPYEGFPGDGAPPAADPPAPGGG